MNRVKNISITYGVLTGVMYIVFFLVLKMFGLHDKPWLRVFNGFIMAFGIYQAIKQYKKATNNYLKYHSGFVTGLYTGMVSTFVFVFFMAVYMFHIDTGFPKEVMDTWFTDYNQGGGILIFLLLVEGMSSSMILTLLVMQGMKESWNSRFSKKNESKFVNHL